MTKKTTGLIVGKFYPFHKGHQFLVETGLANVDHLTVMLCEIEGGSKYGDISAETRADWIRTLYPQADVRIYFHDESMDDDTPAASEIWGKATIEFLGYAPDLVFTSENYGEFYAKAMGSKHHLVDLKRKKVNISGTKIRKDPIEHWDKMHDIVKPHFVKKVVILGAESTGTTTLAKALAKDLNTCWVPEYGRFYYEGRMHTKDADKWATEEFAHIAGMQNKMEDSLKTVANKYLICDTDAFATTVWHERYVGERASELDELVKKEDDVLYILTNTDIPFEQDGTRDGENIRQWMHEEFIRQLEARSVKYIVVSGSRAKRLREGKEFISNTDL